MAVPAAWAPPRLDCSAGGAKVVVGCVLDDQGRQVEAKINESCGACVFVPLDVTSEGNWLEAVAVTTSR